MGALAHRFTRQGFLRFRHPAGPAKEKPRSVPGPVGAHWHPLGGRASSATAYAVPARLPVMKGTNRRFVGNSDSKAAGPDEETGGFAFVPHTCRFLGRYRAGRRSEYCPRQGVDPKRSLGTVHPDASKITPVGSMSSALLSIHTDFLEYRGNRIGGRRKFPAILPDLALCWLLLIPIAPKVAPRSPTDRG
jgi:hypothetical protein